MPSQPSTDQSLRAENAELRARLEDAEEMLRAIRAGEVDARVVEGNAGPQLFTLQGLDAEQNRFRGEMLAHVSDAVIAVDSEERIIFLNTAAERLYGVSASDVLGHALSELHEYRWLRPEDEAESMTALRERGEWHGETLHLTRHGRELHVESSVSLLRGPDGAPAGKISAIRDITKRKEAEAAQHRNTVLFSTIIEQAPGGVYVVNAQFRVAQMNAEALPFFASVQPVIGRDLDEVLEHVWGPEIGPQCASIFRHTLATGERYVSPRFSELRQDIGVEQAFQWETQRITLPDGQHGVVCYFQEVTGRERAEAALQQLNERFDLAVKCSQAVLWQQDLDLRFTWLHNPAPGIDGSDAVGKRDEDLLERAEDVAVIVGLKREVIRTGVAMRREFSPQIQGAGHCFEVLMEPLRDAAGRITGITGAAIDITELKRAGEARHEMERNYRALAVASSEVAYRMSADWATMLGLDGRQLVASSDQPLVDWAWLDQNIPRDEHPRVREAISDAIARKTLFELEHRVRRPDGSIGWTFSRAVPILDANKELIAWFGAASDITERKQAEAALRESEERIQQALRVSQSYTFAWNVLTDRVSRSASAAAILDLAGKEAVSDTALSFFQRIHPDDRERVFALVRGLRPEARDYTVDYRVVHADGAVASLEEVGRGSFDAAGKLVRIEGVATDVTRRRRAEAALREATEKAVAANVAKDRFLAALSHEMRTPLTPVLLVAELNSQSKTIAEDLREDFAMIHRNIVLEAQLIDDLLDVSRIQQGKMRFAFKLVDVHEAVSSSLEMLRSEVEQKGIAVRRKLHATPATIKADPARLRQILSNLLRNAVKFTPRGGTITVRTARDQGALQISIADTGAGIAAEDRERIFQPFEQVEARQESEHRGLGLGLAISAAIVAAHRGRIWAESPGPGQGATFHVELPS